MSAALPLSLLQMLPEENRGLRLFALLLLLAPAAFWPLEAWLRKAAPDRAADDDEPARGRDYYIGFTVGQHLRAADVDDFLRLLRTESYPIQMSKDNGGQKVFTCRNLPPTRGTLHDLEAGVLAGGLFRATGTRFEVEEERCAAKGDGYCKFVAVKG